MRRIAQLPEYLVELPNTSAIEFRGTGCAGKLTLFCPRAMHFTPKPTLPSLGHRETGAKASSSLAGAGNLLGVAMIRPATAPHRLIRGWLRRRSAYWLPNCTEFPASRSGASLSWVMEGVAMRCKFSVIRPTGNVRFHTGEGMAPRNCRPLIAAFLAADTDSEAFEFATAHLQMQQ
jgi:hypothetical protein